ncbi:hypothetical protein CR513_10835, partial [Mucuna pruriens]
MTLSRTVGVGDRSECHLPLSRTIYRSQASRIAEKKDKRQQAKGYRTRNMVLVKRHNRKWQICIDYSDLKGMPPKVAHVSKVGYYWPTMREDYRLYVRSCHESQAHSPIDHSPAKELQHIMTP